MKKLYGILAATTLLAGTGTALAETFDPLDPLISYVCSGVGTGCAQADNGTFTPLPGTDFGWKIAPGPATGTLNIGIFVPTDQINLGTFVLPTLSDNGGLLAGIIKLAILLNAADGSSIATYLGLPSAGSYSPTDNFAGLSAGTLVEDPTFNGNYLSFKISLTGVTLDGQGGGTTLLNGFSFGANLPAGTVIAGFFEETSGPNPGAFVGTAQSNDLVVTPQLVDTTPIPGAVWLFGSVAAAFGLVTRRRKNAKTAWSMARA